MRLLSRLCFVALLIPATGCHSETHGGEELLLRTRARVAAAEGEGADAGYLVQEETVAWEPSRTAIIICDMWDDHWCKGASRRVAEMADAMNQVVEASRDRGVFVIHSPSTTVSPYEGLAARKRAQEAPFAEPPVPLSSAERWGTHWCWPDPKREPDLPIDDADMGCDCEEKCEIREAWSRQIDTIRIDDADAISDDGQEVYNLLEERGIDNVILMGVHLNMCVLGRPFGIRQMVNVGKNVVLVRDLTDTMYNSDMAPKVNHFKGTELVIEHIEKYWCPSISCIDLAGGEPFRFVESPPTR